MGKLLLSHRYNSLPLLRSHPGGVQEELAVKDLPATKVEKFLNDRVLFCAEGFYWAILSLISVFKRIGKLWNLRVGVSNTLILSA